MRSVSALRGGGIHVLERASEVVSVGGVDVGIVGTKGFIGGFTGSLLPDFGEPLLRRVYAETSAEVSALDRGLRRVCDCQSASSSSTTRRRRRRSRASPRRSGPFSAASAWRSRSPSTGPTSSSTATATAEPFPAEIDGIPVFNVGVPVIGRDFWVFEFDESGLVWSLEAVESTG